MGNSGGWVVTRSSSPLRPVLEKAAAGYEVPLKQLPDEAAGAGGSGGG
jgi:hypothetical protein